MAKEWGRSLRMCFQRVRLLAWIFSKKNIKVSTKVYFLLLEIPFSQNLYIFFQLYSKVMFSLQDLISHFYGHVSDSKSLKSKSLAFHVSVEIRGWCIILLSWFLINLATKHLIPSKSLECCRLLRERAITQEIPFLQKKVIKKPNKKP